MHLICGEALYDVFADDHASGHEGEVLLRAVMGGSPLNVAIGMARLGREVALASDIAADFLGERIIAQLAQEGVSDRCVRRTAPATALALIALDASGQPQYSFTGLEQAKYCPAEDMLAALADTISGLHVGSIATVLPNSAQKLRDLVRSYADRALVSLDPNVRLSIEPDRALWQSAIDELRLFCQVIKVSEEDIAALYGDIDAAALCQSWLGERTALVVLTKGAEGAAMFTRSLGQIDVPPAATRVVDTVGAGDSFMAALLSYLTDNGWTSAPVIAALELNQIRDLGSFAARASGLTCSRRGPVLPTVQELDATLAPSPLGEA